MQTQKCKEKLYDPKKEFSVLTVADFSKIAGKVISESAAEGLLLYTGLLQIVLRGRINKSQSNQVHCIRENRLK